MSDKRESKRNPSIRVIGLLGILPVILSGCGDKPFADLEKYIQQIKSRPQKPIKPLPISKPYETFTYQASEFRDPFTPDGQSMVSTNPDQSTVTPDIKRHKEPLEEYTLDSLKMVGVLENKEEIWAIMRAPDGMLYRIKEGNYMGKNYGKVTAIHEELIELTELIADEKGGWSEHQATLMLTE
ncbi:pilus assembly protein PilP [Candidatus Nitrosoglobus terrae]|uniref:Pilus assembly protein PilP n=1 Tax=Candidatus Nitrosoglobus terrae TaxID=1630141 RepID=A0A1Q2SPV3_9GAMM|nr:pilus assembly protein PilP [Candidatus Nitrosoglobus terrae]BAW81137.1 pilus assembly protein PilP [Candidatus Nitrosoglobus terrae]